MELAVGFGERCSARTPVVENERPLVHVGQQARSDDRVCPGTQCHKHEGRDDRQPRVVQHAAKRALVRARERVQRGADACEQSLRVLLWMAGSRARACLVLGVGVGQELLGEQRNDRQGQHERYQHAHRERQ